MNSGFDTVTATEGICLFWSGPVMHSCGTHDSEMAAVGASGVTLDLLHLL